jgi:uncharacterized protein (DUF4415 family)
VKKPSSNGSKPKKSYTTPDGEALELDEEWFASATLHRGKPKPPARVPVSLRMEPAVLEYFKATGPGYQTRMQRVLSMYVKAAKQKPLRTGTKARG